MKQQIIIKKEWIKPEIKFLLIEKITAGGKKNTLEPPGKLS
jgi:hypothetical protein